MNEPIKSPEYLWRLFTELRRRQFLLGPQDYDEVRQALRLGFGWESRNALLNLLCALWTKSKEEQEILITLFEQDNEIPEWETDNSIDVRNNVSYPEPQKGPSITTFILKQLKEAGRRISVLSDRIFKVFSKSPSSESKTSPRQEEPDRSIEIETEKEPEEGLPFIPENLELPKTPVILVPEYPVSERDTAQTWRRLRRVVRIGPPVELDINATITRRVQQGVAVDMVLRPRRRNTTRLLLLVDQFGSMAPYQQFVNTICKAIQHTSNIQNAEIYYFHDVPVQSKQLEDSQILKPINNELFPVLDRILKSIEPSTNGKVSTNSNPPQYFPLSEILNEHAYGAAITIISDAGAARGRYDFRRLFSTVAFLKALKLCTNQFVWLNPVQREDWKYGTAKQIQRYIPMFEMNREGFSLAVDVLRGHPYYIEQPL